MEGKSEFSELWELMKMLFILSHGQASVERGFSINKDILTSNLSKRTLVAQRLVTDAVRSKLPNVHEVHKLPITKKLMSNCRAARMRYQQYLDQEKEKEISTAASKRKLHLQQQVSDTKAKRLKLENTVERHLIEADMLAKKAEKNNDFSLLTQSNALRSKVSKL